MMRKLMLLLGLTAALPLAQNRSDYLMTGQGWREWSSVMRSGYVIGFFEGYNSAMMAVVTSGVLTSQVLTKLPNREYSACVSGMTYGQTVAMMDKYVADHPEKWNKKISELLIEATEKACLSER